MFYENLGMFPVFQNQFSKLCVGNQNKFFKTWEQLEKNDENNLQNLNFSTF